MASLDEMLGNPIDLVNFLNAGGAIAVSLDSASSQGTSRNPNSDHIWRDDSTDYGVRPDHRAVPYLRTAEDCHSRRYPHV